MKKIIQSVAPQVVPASGVDEAAIAQASLSESKDMVQLLKSEEIKSNEA